ncbi:PREDICTED: diffuse panbronchiolitis critical region protein 1-like [Condylura cristata]|uniref:diffuse panbronchiolitis critical region protein 1-like n=1 Tax=Condylura cristata TaxID=143302 RepID=UPI00064379D1|nr:PREDICTED: diffuse panbronchiolitis critical region protein 1-like [Condylura cristata]
MAQPAHSICSTFGLQCCLLFLLAPWEAGAATIQELQKPGESSTSAHLVPTPMPSLSHSSASDHVALRSGHSPPGLPKSTETQKPKRHCNSTRHSKTIHKPTDSPQNTTIHLEVPSTSDQNSTSQRKDPFIRNERSTDTSNTHKESSDPTIWIMGNRSLMG